MDDAIASLMVVTGWLLLLLLLGALYGCWLLLRRAWSKLRDAAERYDSEYHAYWAQRAGPEWTDGDKRWALALIERTPCACTRLYNGEYARCERCDFLRKLTPMREDAAHG